MKFLNYPDTNWIKENKENILLKISMLKQESIKQCIEYDKIKDDRDSIITDIQQKITKYNIDPFELFDYSDLEKAVEMDFDEPDTDFYCTEGVNYLRKVLDSLDIEYKCKTCLVSPMCFECNEYDKLIDSNKNHCSESNIFNTEVINWLISEFGGENV